MLFRYKIKRRCFRFLDKSSIGISRAEFFLESWSSLGAIANDEWGIYIPAKNTYKYAEAWHLREGRSVAAFHEVNRRNQINVCDAMYKFWMQEYEKDRDPISLKGAQDMLVNKRKLEVCPSNKLNSYIPEYLGG